MRMEAGGRSFSVAAKDSGRTFVKAAGFRSGVGQASGLEVDHVTWGHDAAIRIIRQEGMWVRVWIDAKDSRTVRWRVTFEPRD